MLDRRDFIAALAAFAGCSDAAPELPGPEEASKQPFEFVPHVVGANTAIAGWGFFEAVELLAELGFPTIEVQNLVGSLEPTPGEFPGFRVDQISAPERERIVASLAPFEHVTVHLPYSMPYILPEASDSVEAFETTFDAAALCGAKLAVLHPQPRETDLLQHWDVAVERIRRWADLAADRGFRIAVETGAPPSVPDCVRLLDEVGHENVGAALDVGHQANFAALSRFTSDQYPTADAIRAYNDLNLRLVDALGEKLLHLHIHDIEPRPGRSTSP